MFGVKAIVERESSVLWGGCGVGNEAEIESAVRTSPIYPIPTLERQRALWGAKVLAHLLYGCL